MNRLVGNVIIIDSAMGNSLMLTSANQTINITGFKLSGIGFRGINTSSQIAISGANTADVIYYQGYIQGGSGGNVSTFIDKLYDITHFGSPLYISDLKVPVLTAATGYLYLA